MCVNGFWLEYVQKEFKAILSVFSYYLLLFPPNTFAFILDSIKDL